MPPHLTLQGDKLPGDVRVRAYRAREAISTPYEVDVEISTTDTSFRIDDCLRRRVVLEVTDAAEQVRFYDGLPDQAEFLTYDGDELFFRLRLRPAIAALEHREGSAIYQGKSPVDVIKDVLSAAGVDQDVEWRLRQTYAPRELLCQYRETELHFVERLLEEEGIFYFFLRSAKGHKLVFADDPDAFTSPDGQGPVLLTPRPGAAPGAQPLLAFSREKTLRPTLVALRDYDFEKPAVFPEASLPAPGPYPLLHFEYPGGFTAGPEGARRARARISALRGDIDRCHGKSRAAGLVCGTPMRVEGANEPHLNGDFIVVALTSGGREGAESCENELVAIPKGAPFAAPRRAKKPRIRGIQTAVVTGPSNEPQAIHVDKYGRIKVRFLWDRSAKQDDTSSAWIRVSQVGLGGSMILPRVGWEVSVAFLDGDPDRPIVLGRAYDAEHTPPYAQPGAAADGSMKSMSTPGGAGHNEIKASDTAGKQGLSLSAQKDLNRTTGNDKNETVAVNDDHSIGSNYSLTVGSNETITISGNQSIDVGNALQVKVSGAQSVTVGGNESDQAKADFVEKVGGARDYSVGGNQITISNGVRKDITGAFTRDVGAVQVSMSAGSIHDKMLSTYDESVGAVILQLAKGPVIETVGAGKDCTSTAAELHVVPLLQTSAKGVKQLIGGLHLRKVGGDVVVSAPKIVLGGGVGQFNGGGSSLKLSGGPVKLTGSVIAIDAAAVVKLASDLKIG
ncbi:MAG: type VI secretion system tip protein TssI/VgrG [Byssovorax sp.]